MRALRVELRKVARLRWTWLSVIGMNVFSAAVFLIFLILYYETPALQQAAEYGSPMLRQAGGILYFVFVTETWVFSVLGFFFLGVMTARLFGSEFSSGAIGLLFLSPNRRRKIFGAKLTVVLLLYGVAFLLNLCIQSCTILLLSRVDRLFIRLLDFGVLVKLYGATVLTDVSWLAFLVLMSVLSRGIAGTLFYTMAAYFFFLFMDALMWLGGHYQFIPAWVVKMGAFSFTNSCRILVPEEVVAYFMGTGDVFPVNPGLLGLNAAYTLVFLGLACFAFCRREI